MSTEKTLREALERGVALVESAFAHVSHGGPTRTDAEKWLESARAALSAPALEPPDAKAMAYLRKLISVTQDAELKQYLQIVVQCIEREAAPALEGERRVIEFDLKAAQRLLDFFGGDETLVSVGYGPDGLLAWPSEYPDEGSIILRALAAQREAGK